MDMVSAKSAALPRLYRPTLFRRGVREVTKVVFRVLFRSLSRVRVTGQEHVPAQGPYMVVFNHVSIYDPPVVVAFWPHQVEILGAVEVWSRKGQAFLAKLWGGIPIRRAEVHREAIDLTLSVLRSDLPLLLSPEGTRSHLPGLQKAKTGVVYIAEKSKAPIIPVGLTGTTDDFFQRAIHGDHPSINMAIGKPFTLPESLDDPGLPPREVRQRKADYIMQRIADLLPPTYHGYYHA
jgi:1-acyl-sn-glycerol-3-phosphate acyltransferase